MHLEKEKNDAQFQQVLNLKNRLRQIDYKKSFTKVEPGALVQTSIGWLFILESIGKIILDGEKFQVISILSPIGQLLKGSSMGEVHSFNGKKIEILNLI